MKKILIIACAFFIHKVYSQKIVRSLNDCNWTFKNKSDSLWHPAKVPGTIHTDLLENKLIPDPFFGTNEKGLQWIDSGSWQYQCFFDISPNEFAKNHIELQFKGLDTYASVYLNDRLIQVADNMFRSWTIDIKQQAIPGKNKLTIVFESAVLKGKELANKLRYTLPGEEKVFTRKAQYQYGWDWGPRFVTCGISQSVLLTCWNKARLVSIQSIQKTLNDTIAELQFKCEIESDIDNSIFISISNTIPAHAPFTKLAKVHAKKGIAKYTIDYNIQKPKRWWCNGLGKANLYTFNFALDDNNTQLDSKQITIGLRTIELVNEKDSLGSSFYFKLNGKSVFMRGANYIPQDNFIPRLNNEAYKTIIKNAADANMNMLRVWGGGIYVREAFYEECDKNGILVWQDFMFACAMYPGDSNFIHNIEAEAKEQVQRLRNHPCIALWCGNNEINEGWQNWGWQKQYNYSKKDSTEIADNNTYIFDHLIKDIVIYNDGSRPYWTTSPSIGWGHNESYTNGDSHYWGVWWGMEPFEKYKSKTGRFVSEYGFQSMPNISTLGKVGLFKNNSQNEIDSAVLKAHQKHPKGYETITAYMLRDYKLPKNNIEHFDYISQLLQAEGMRIAIESHRRKKPYCMGTLYWQLNDCWPVTSWSTIDYYNNYKASHYQVIRSYKNVILSVTEEKDSIYIFAISDQLQNIEKAALSIRLATLAGQEQWSQIIAVTIEANSSKAIVALPKDILKGNDLNNLYLNSTLTIPGIDWLKASSIHYFVKPKALNLRKANYIIKENNCGSAQCFTIKADALMKNVRIKIDDVETNLSENYIDVLPNDPITIYLPKHLKVKSLKKKIKLLSLIDTY